MLDTLTNPVDELNIGDEARCTLQFVASRQPFCDLPARWANRLGCCGQIKVVCDDHRDIAASVAPKQFVCNRCGHNSPRIVATWPV